MMKINQNENFLHCDITGQVVKAFYKVYNYLGHGFLEKVYLNAMYLELIDSGFQCTRNKSIVVSYKEKNVGTYYADLIVNDCVILELKAAEMLSREHELQLINYLKATPIEVGLLLNFGKEPQLVRKIFTNDRKPQLFKAQ